MSPVKRITSILVTGGAGYIGCHCVVELLEAGYNVIVIDNCINAHINHGQDKPESLIVAEQLTNRNIYYYNVDISNKLQLSRIFENVSKLLPGASNFVLFL